MNPMLIYVAAGTSAAAVAGLLYGVYTFVAPSRTAADRLAELTGGPEESLRQGGRKIASLRTV